MAHFVQHPQWHCREPLLAQEQQAELAEGSGNPTVEGGDPCQSQHLGRNAGSGMAGTGVGTVAHHMVVGMPKVRSCSSLGNVADCLPSEQDAVAYVVVAAGVVAVPLVTMALVVEVTVVMEAAVESVHSWVAQVQVPCHQCSVVADE